MDTVQYSYLKGN